MIENYIPSGYKNRISRDTLSAVTHKSDRVNRKLMEDALLERGILIVNIDNGYFIPDGSHEDTERAKAYLRREKVRTGSCSRRCKAIEQCLKPPKSDEVTKNQLDLFKDCGLGGG